MAHSGDWQGDAGCWLEAAGLLYTGLSEGCLRALEARRVPAERATWGA